MGDYDKNHYKDPVIPIKNAQYNGKYPSFLSLENIGKQHHMIGVVTPGTLRLKDASHEPFTFRWGNPVENMSKFARRSFF